MTLMLQVTTSDDRSVYLAPERIESVELYHGVTHIALIGVEYAMKVKETVSVVLALRSAAKRMTPGKTSAVYWDGDHVQTLT